MTSIIPSNRTTRIGIHYFTDDHHYREQDAEQWIPQLHDLGLSWLVLTTTTERAIPEYFINALVEAKIKPILHFNNIS